MQRGRIEKYIAEKIRSWILAIPTPPVQQCDKFRPELSGKESLNLAKGYNGTQPTDVKEIVQNWFDQCKHVAGQNVTVASSLNDLKDHQIENLGCLAIAVAPNAKGEQGPVALGYMYSFLDLHQEITSFVAVNYASNMDLADLVIGKSGKRGEENMAGFFGEGCKITINRLTAAGAKVSYRTNSSLWTFVHEEIYPGAGAKLFVVSEVLPPNERNTEVEVQVNSTRQNDDLVSKLLQIVPEHYLFLWRRGWIDRADQKTFDSVHNAQKADIELIYKPEALRGYVYFNDILVMKEKDQTIGFNFIGNPKNAIQDGLRRDRDNVNVASIIYKNLPLLLEEFPPIEIENGLPVESSHQKNFNSPIAGKVCKSILEEVRAEYPKGETPRTCFTAKGWLTSAISQMQLMAFTKPNLGHIKEFLIYYLIKEECLKEPSKALFQYVPVSDQNAALEESTAALLGASLISIPMVLMQLIGKSDCCPTMKMNWRRCHEIISNLPDASANFSLEEKAWATFTTDLLMHLFDINKEKRRQSITFKDFQNQGISKSIIHIRTPDYEGYVIDVSMLDMNKVHLRLKSDGIDCEGKEKCGFFCAREVLIDDFKWCLKNDRGKYVDEKLLDRQIRLKLLKMNDKVPTMNSNGVEPTTKNIAPSSLPPRPDEHFEKEIERPFPSFGAAVLEKHGETKKIVRSAPQPMDTVPIQPTTCEPKSDLDCKGQTKYKDRVFLFYLPSNGDTKDHCDPTNMMRILDGILSDVFGNKDGDVGIFFDQHSSTIAFNKGGLLFFNVAFDKGLSNEKERAIFWYHIIAHELTHNEVHAHNEVFAGRLGDVLTAKFASFEEHYRKLFPN